MTTPLTTKFGQISTREDGERERYISIQAGRLSIATISGGETEAGERRYSFGITLSEADEYAELIVRAVNAHEALLTAAKAAENLLKWLPNIPENVEAVDALRAAISLAEGQQ